MSMSIIVAVAVVVGLFTSLLIQAWEARTQEAQGTQADQVFKTWAAFLKADDQASKAWAAWIDQDSQEAWAAYEAASQTAREAREAHEAARTAAAQAALRRALGLEPR